jgi:hypothetical protein
MSDPAALSMDELDAQLATWASHLTAGMCRWLELVAEADRRGVGVDGFGGTCAAWLAWRCALTPRAAREHLRVARRLKELPLIHEAFARGQLSYAKVRALTRVAEPETERELIELASVLTAAQLERALRAYRRVTAAEAVEPYERACVSVWWDDDGSLQIRGRLAPEDAPSSPRHWRPPEPDFGKEHAVPRNRRRWSMHSSRWPVAGRNRSRSSCTSTRTHSRAIAARAWSKTGLRSRQRQHGGWPATRPWSGSGSDRGGL